LGGAHFYLAISALAHAGSIANRVAAAPRRSKHRRHSGELRKIRICIIVPLIRRRGNLKFVI